MKRFLWASGAMLFSFVLVGCSGDSYEGLVEDTIGMISNATAAIKDINKQVEIAIENKQKGGQTFDLTKAIAATRKLKKVGEDAQYLKKRIEELRAQITDEQRKTYAQKQKDKLNDAFKTLLKQKEELRTTLANAEKGSDNQITTGVKDLREKLVEAEGPFEALAR